jgi:hypothetical protein
MFQRATKITANRLLKTTVISAATTIGLYLFHKKNLSQFTNFPNINFFGKFNLQNKIPQAANARQIFLENPDIGFVGVYNNKTKEITLMPAISDKGLTFSYDDKDEITQVTRTVRKKKTKTSYFYDEEQEPISEEELKLIKENHKFFIPRCYKKSDYTELFAAHQLMLDRMGTNHKAILYGFSIPPRKNGVIEIIGISGSLNNDKYDCDGRYLPYNIQTEIQKMLNAWQESESRPSDTAFLVI